MKRAYRLGKRAETAAATRRRILEVARQLAATIGPRATTIAEIARMAGVERLTVYNHFATDGALWSAVTSEWLVQHPRPDPAALGRIVDPIKRLSAGIDQLYGWYEASEAVLRWMERDTAAMPGLAGPRAEADAHQAAFEAALLEGWTATPWSGAALRTGLSFGSWDSLCRKSGLARDEAAALVVAWIRAN